VQESDHRGGLTVEAEGQTAVGEHPRIRPFHDPSHSATRWTSVAWASTDCGMVGPTARAVLRLMTKSNLVGCSS